MAASQSVVAVKDVIEILKKAGVNIKEIDALLEKKVFKATRKGYSIAVGIKDGHCIGVTMKQEGPLERLDFLVVDYDIENYPQSEVKEIDVLGQPVKAAIDRMSAEQGDDANKFINAIRTQLP